MKQYCMLPIIVAGSFKKNFANVEKPQSRTLNAYLAQGGKGKYST
jgi:hypothetical protein